MIVLRCLHPPGGAAALLVVLDGVVEWRFALFPVFTNSVLVTSDVGRFVDADIDRVLARYNQVLDLPRDELHALLEAAESEAYRRRLAELCCADVMSRNVVSVEFGTGLQEAWALLRQRQIKALPVVDKARRVVGVLTVADFMQDLDIDAHKA